MTKVTSYNGLEEQKATEQYIPIKMPPSKRIADFSEKNAKKLGRELKKYIGQKMILYGGGGFDQNLVKLEGVKVEQTPLYKRENEELPGNAKSIAPENGQERYVLPNVWYVSPELRTYEQIGYSSKNHFNPHLGSWRLARIVRIKTRKKVLV